MDHASPSAPAAPVPTASDVWQPLPATEWNEDAARHLLRRTGWSARPEAVTLTLKEGLTATLERLFPSTAPAEFPKPKLITNLQEDTPDFAQRLRTAAPEDKRLLQKEARDRSQQAMADMAVRWLQFAAVPARAAVEKWTLFLSDIYVVSFEKVHNAALLYLHHAALRNHSLGSAPALTRAVSRSPAMVQYLDLQESKKDAPNENFARELFELFLLGEGHYTEQDIKDAARAFTGYRQRFGEYFFVPRQHDNGRKTVFGHTGNFSGNNIIELAYAQPAARTFLPGEMVRFYLTEEPLPAAQLQALGDEWRKNHYDLRALALRFFGSRLFFDASYRCNYIKSPVQFYLGLVQDLQLDVAPLPRPLLGALRQMGQALFIPPNVRGWLGGRHWINSSTLSARRQLVQSLFSPINEALLNADEQAELAAARTEGRSHFTLDPERLKSYDGLSAEQTADRLIDTFLPGKVDAAFRLEVRRFLSDNGLKAKPLERLRLAAVTLLQSPEYQLC